VSALASKQAALATRWLLSQTHACDWGRGGRALAPRVEVGLGCTFSPICASCKQIRDERGAWQPVEVYIRDRSEADFTHGLWPSCVGEYTPPEGLGWPSDG